MLAMEMLIETVGGWIFIASKILNMNVPIKSLVPQCCRFPTFFFFFFLMALTAELAERINHSVLILIRYCFYGNS